MLISRPIYILSSQVDRLAALSLRKPVRIEVDPLFDLAQRLVQDFVRVRRSREADREAMLLARFILQHVSCLLCCSAALACLAACDDNHIHSATQVQQQNKSCTVWR